MRLPFELEFWKSGAVLVPLWSFVLFCTAAAGQVRVQVAGPGGAILGGANPGEGDSRTNVQMFESQGIARRLRKAMDFLSRNEFESAIKVLQDVVEGRVTGIELEEDAPKPKPDSKSDPKAGPGQKPVDPSKAKAQDPFDEENPSKAVFALDDRLYRPVRRLCQEYLAQMPAPGLELYRARFEVPATQAFEQALARRDERMLQDVAQRWFVTFAGARAMIASGDLLMDAGRFRAAILNYQTVLDLWPAADLPKVLNPVSVRTRIAACCQQLGESRRVAEILNQITTNDPNATVRILGEVMPVKSLSQHPLFASVETDTARPGAPARLLLDQPSKARLVHLWEHRFADPDPYRAASADRNQNDWVLMGEEGASLPSPRADAFKPGGFVHFERDGVVLFDHFQMRIHELLSGRVRGLGPGPRETPRIRTGQPRVRVPVYDYAMLRPCFDADRVYYVSGPERATTGASRRPEFNSELVALDRTSLQRLWGSREIAEQAVKDLTFLTVPTCFGDRLLAPVLDRGAYALQCLEAATGKPVWRVHVNSGGSEFARGLATPVVVEGGTAFMLCNAGTLAAVDAFTGELRWARKYEIEHPYRTPPTRLRSRVNTPMGLGAYYREADVTGFGPSDLVVRDGRVAIAPVGGNVILCIDGSTGEVIWMQSRATPMRYVLGANQKHLYMGGASITCIDWRTGILLWESEPPPSRIAARFAGRGLVTDEWIVLPDERCLQVLPADGKGSGWDSVPLPASQVQDDALRGPFNVFGAGAFLACAYEGGVELYAIADAAEEQAQAIAEPLERARWLATIGELASATLLVESLIPNATGEERTRLGKLALTWMRDQAHALALAGEKVEALRLLDRALVWADGGDLAVRWRLARIDVLQTCNDMQSLAVERDALERAIEGGR